MPSFAGRGIATTSLPLFQNLFDSHSHCGVATVASAGGFDIFHEGKETFGERGVDVDGALQQRMRLVREHESAEDLHQLASFGGEDGSAKDAVVRSIDDNFHEAGGFAALNGTRHIG